MKKDGSTINMESHEMISNIEKQAKDGIDFMAIPCSVKQRKHSKKDKEELVV